MSDSPDKTTGRFGAFEGVFVPTTLTILGVILFVRTGWVVGQVGLLGSWLIIAGAYAISAATALSIASIVTNVRVEAGGAFALLTRTLGIEPGGSIGLPLYLSQTLAITMYLFGFREGWLWLFPEHPAWLVDVGAFGVVFGLATLSARLAFRVQYAILAIIAASLVSIVAGLWTVEPLQSPTWWTPDGEVGLAAAFAVFFPAVTGIMAGVNLSGDLREPRRAIRRGSLWAIGLTFVIYVAVAGVISVLVSSETLSSSSSSRTALIDAGAWSPAVLAGLLAATFSSALSTAVGAPRILEALAQHKVVPASSLLTVRWRQEPVGALAITAAISGLALLARDLNAIAPLITLFFLLTYGAINATLLVQQGLDLPRFRPSFRVPLGVPLIGTVGSAVAMWLVSPLATVVAVAAVVGVYIWLANREVAGPYGQARAGIVIAAAAWLRSRVAGVPARYAWQLHVVLPVLDAERERGFARLLTPLARGGGSVLLLGADSDAEQRLQRVADALQASGTSCRIASVDGEDPLDAVARALPLLAATRAPPNLLLLPLALDAPALASSDALERLRERAEQVGIGLWLVDLPDQEESRDLEALSRMVLWIEGPSTVGQREGALELLLVAAWRFARAWEPAVEVTVRVDEEGERERAIRAARVARTRARLPEATLSAHVGDLERALLDDDEDTLHLIVLEGPLDRQRVASLCEAAGGRLVIGCLSGEARAD